MTVARIHRDDPRVGVVLAVRTGVLEVLVDDGRIRATLDGSLLAAVARDRSRMPGVGEWVRLRGWPDGRVTVVGPMGAASGRTAAAVVVPLRRRDTSG
ncbi:MAG: hypothetical protein ACTHNS_11750 [Marmoricola sp.]